MTIKHLIGAIALSLFGVVVFAQPEQGQWGKRPKMNPEAQKEIKAYVEKNVLPVLQPERAKLDTYLSQDDKAELASIRGEIKSMKAQGKEFRKAMMEARKNGTMPSEDQIDKMREMRKNQRLLMTRAWAVADEYEIEIYEIFDGLKPKAESWKNDLKAIKDKYKPEGAEDRQGRQGKKGMGHKQGKGMRGGNPVERLIHSPVQFLLWDGSTELPQVNEGSQPTVFPNPSQGNQTLTYKVKTAGDVKIELVDAEGNVVRTVERSQVEKGEQSIDFSTQGLKSGVYIYRITTADGTKTKKIQIN
ncbi:MAG: T9SS type A sorting domain-containing protein [Bacteroidia bacterium]|nr:T9SS type A sorting domain-containing protein [Bacteroidia bacterium]